MWDFVLTNMEYYSHTCKCGCVGQIEIKEHHKYKGIPLYIHGHNKPFKGKKFTDEHRNNLRLANTGKKRTEESRKKQSKLMEGHFVSEETKNKQRGINNPMYGTHRVGELNPNWQNGKSFEEYSSEFNKELKSKIKQRDNYTCQCPDYEHKSNILDVHHIDYDKKNNNPENLITLCRSCHSKTNGKKNRKYYTKYYQEILNVYL